MITRTTNIFWRLALVATCLPVYTLIDARITKPPLSTATPRTVQWGYGLGDGPDTWTGECRGGHRQSPIDIAPERVKETDISELTFINYDETGDLEIENNGATLHVTGFEKWKNRPQIKGANLDGTYQLLQFHMHWAQNDTTGSEHTVDLLYYPVEMHFVHVKGDSTFTEALKLDDGIAVVAIFGSDGTDPKPWDALVYYFPLVAGVGNTTTMSGYSMQTLLPSDTSSFYTYPGSLTTPPCTEDVTWIVLAQNISITENQLEILRNTSGRDGDPEDHNDRPLQEPDKRQILFRKAKSAASTYSYPVALAVTMILPLTRIMAQL